MHPVIIYLHGFNSSPRSHKARVLQKTMRERGLEDCLRIPRIPPGPAEAFAMLCELYDSLGNNGQPVAVAGSSLGGFYATLLAERTGARAVLINPATRPYILLQQYVGENTNYHTAETWVMENAHIQELREIDTGFITRPERYLLMLQTGDEILDYRQALQKYRGCAAMVEQGGSHAFDNFDRHVDRILTFCEGNDMTRDTVRAGGTS